LPAAKAGSGGDTPAGFPIRVPAIHKELVPSRKYFMGAAILP